MKTEDILGHLSKAGKAISDEARKTEVSAERNHGDSFQLGYADGMIEALRLLSRSLGALGIKVDVFASDAEDVTGKAVELAEYTTIDASLWNDFGSDAISLLSRIHQYISFADYPHITHDDYCDPVHGDCVCGLEDLIEEIDEFFKEPEWSEDDSSEAIS
jgi:hypothetical protein